MPQALPKPDKPNPARGVPENIPEAVRAPEPGRASAPGQPSRMDLVAVARASSEQAQLMSPFHFLRLESPDGPLEGWWDRGRLGQVFANLVGNAIKYSPPGGEVLVRIEDLGLTARVTIRDRGPGIAPEALPRLFDQFYRAPATAGMAPGLGVGLH